MTNPEPPLVKKLAQDVKVGELVKLNTSAEIRGCPSGVGRVYRKEASFIPKQLLAAGVTPTMLYFHDVWSGANLGGYSNAGQEWEIVPVAPPAPAKKPRAARHAGRKTV